MTDKRDLEHDEPVPAHEPASDADEPSENGDRAPDTDERAPASAQTGHPVRDRITPASYDPFAGVDDSVIGAPSGSVVKGDPTYDIARDEPSIADLDQDAPDSWHERRTRDHAPASDGSDTGKTRSIATQEAYVRRAQGLVRRYLDENGFASEEDLDYRDFVIWLGHFQPPRCSPASWRLYRNAVAHYLSATGDPDALDAAHQLQTMMTQRDHGGESDLDDSKAASECDHRNVKARAKHLNYETYKHIHFYLDRVTRSVYGPIVRDLIDATLFTGLRPSEWPTARVIRESWQDGTEHEILQVLSSKTTNGRGHSVVRSLDISQLPKSGKQVIHNTLETTQNWIDPTIYKRRMKYILGLIKEAHRAARGKRVERDENITLYSCRHQFIANAKKMLPLEEVAALAGRGDTLTARERYGRKAGAWDPAAMNALPRGRSEEIARVQTQMDACRKDRLADAMRRRARGENVELPSDIPDPIDPEGDR